MIHLLRVKKVARTELGIKHSCTSCEAKFYDLNRTPFSCPKCGEVYSAAPVNPPVVKKAKPPAPVQPKKEPVAKKKIDEQETQNDDEADIDEELLADVEDEDKDEDEVDDTGVLIEDDNNADQSVSDIVTGGKPDREST